MKKYLFLSALLAALFLFPRCEYDATPDAFKVFENSDYVGFGRGEAVVQNKQGGHTIAGTNIDPVTLRNTIYVAQADRNGEIKGDFTALFEGASDQAASDMCLTKEGYFAVVGTVRETASAPTHLFFSISDPLGSRTITPKTIDVPGGGDETGVAVLQNRNSEFLLLGHMNNGASTGFDLCISKINANSNVPLINQSLPLAGDQFAVDVCDLGNGTYMLMGLSYEGGNSPYRLIFLLIDDHGNTDASFPVYSEPGKSFSDGGLALHPDGSVMAASAEETTAGTSQLYLTKIRANGTFDTASGFPKTFDEGNLFVYDMHAFDGGFAVAGHLNGKVYLLRTDRDGKETLNKTYGGPSDYAIGSAPTSDGGFILSGIKDFTPTGAQGKLYLVKADPSGNTR